MRGRCSRQWRSMARSNGVFPIAEGSSAALMVRKVSCSWSELGRKNLQRQWVSDGSKLPGADARESSARPGVAAGRSRAGAPPHCASRADARARAAARRRARAGACVPHPAPGTGPTVPNPWRRHVPPRSWRTRRRHRCVGSRRRLWKPVDRAPRRAVAARPARIQGAVM
jgi:hypothetical protein